jgi:primosomal protein N' (replication factor Y)
MQVLTVAPLANGIPYDELTYFSKDEVKPGDLVEISIKKRVCKALVLEAHQAHDERQSLRSATFTMKKINKVVTPQFLDQKMWETLSYIASYLLQSLGVIIYDLLSEKSFEFLMPLLVPVEAKGFERLLLEVNTRERIVRYKTTIREMFSKKKSLVLFFPTITDLEYAESELSRGIEEYVVTLHSGLTEKQYKESQKKLIENQHPLLILSTPSLLPWVRKDLGLVVIEREHSQYYFTHGDHGYDMRFVIESLAQGSQTPCLLGSHMLSLRAHMFFNEQDAHEVIPLQFRNDSPISVVPMTHENKSSSPFFSRTTMSLLHASKLAERGHFFLYAHRKGMYPTTICSDCGALFVCPTCNRPYVLHKIGGVRTYICHGCENIVQLNEDTTLACRLCGGWRMMTLGVATGGVEEELTRLGIPLFVIDGERTTTRAKVKKVHKEWKEAPYGVLLGTEMAHNVVEGCDGVIVLSIDSLFSLPEYRTDEKILNLITEMAEKVHVTQENQGKLILQTRLKNNPILKQLTTPSFREVFNDLLLERKEFLLPPYYTVIRASFDNLADDMRKRIEEELKPHQALWFEHGRGVTLLFVHIKEQDWSKDKELRNRIRRVVFDGKPTVNPLNFFI